MQKFLLLLSIFVCISGMSVWASGYNENTAVAEVDPLFSTWVNDVGIPAFPAYTDRFQAGKDSVTGVHGVAIGFNADSNHVSSIAIGSDTLARVNSVALGTAASAHFDGSIAIGAGATTAANNQVVIKTDVVQLDINAGVADFQTNDVTTTGTVTGDGSGLTGVLKPNAITASGVTCTITAIVDGQITGASCV